MDDKIRKLRDKADKLRLKGQADKALGIYRDLRSMDPDNPRWPHLAGELLHQKGQNAEAAAMFTEAADKYMEQGFGVQAVALAKMALDCAPDHEDARRILHKLARSSHARVAQLAVQHLPGGFDGQREGSRDGSPAREPLSAGRGARAAGSAPPPVPGDAGARRRPSKRQEVKLHSGDTLDGLRLRDVVGSSQELPAIGGDNPLSMADESRQTAQRVKALEDARSEVSMVRAVSAFEVPLVDTQDSGGHFPQPELASVPGGGLTPRLSGLTDRSSVEAVQRTPLFGELDPGTLEEFVARAKVVRYAPGSQVIREGDRGGELYVVIRGGLQVVKEGPPRVVVGELHEGEFFGEISIVTDLPRQASVYAKSDCVLLEISRDMVIELIQDHPEVVSVLLRFFRRRMVEILVKTSPLFTSLDDALRMGIVREFKFLEVDPGVGFIKQGRPVPGLFVILSGTARVTTTDKGRTKLLAELGPGDVVGELALLSGQRAVVRVTAVTKCWMLFMPAKVFREKAVLIPEVVTYLRKLWSERVRAAESAGEMPTDFPVERLPVF